ncbi:MAG TPA: GMP synthase subunit A [Methanoregulaceae archaeon]|nr:GMP synthase subunit A [Methanoregulaceae archaeon]HOV67327.1 GMP synthase subunit A [Methanoregulaceae archaeon]HQJ86966.1 GMP synthase subunit A [Methanoregulaceae archaeon]
MRPIFVVNNFGQFNHLILRMLRDLGIEARMVPNTTPPEEVAGGCRGVILGGGPAIERTGCCAEYLDLDLPVLGICLGLHVIARRFGGVVSPGRMGGYGAVDVDIHDHDRILAGYPGQIRVWASHQDEVSVVPSGFDLLAVSGICPAEAIAHRDRPIFGIQWHPEVSHTVDGQRVYLNFDRICRKEA